MEPLEIILALGTSIFVIVGTVLGVVIPFFRQISQTIEKSEVRQTRALKETEAGQIQALKQTESRLTASIEKNESEIKALDSKLMQIDRRVYTLNGLVQRLVGHTFGMEEEVEREEGHAPVPS